jgi:hypothetical protein
MNDQSSNSLPFQNSSILAIIEQDLFKQSQILPQDIIDNDPVDFNLSSDEQKSLYSSIYIP